MKLVVAREGMKVRDKKFQPAAKSLAGSQEGHRGAAGVFSRLDWDI